MFVPDGLDIGRRTAGDAPCVATDDVTPERHTRGPVVRAWPLLLLLLSALLSSAGCVERELVVETQPAGAEVFVDGRDVGRTDEGAPVRVPFDHYGVVVVVARKPGHVPERRRVVLDPPWWQLPPVDLVTDLLWPGTITDERRLEPLVLAPRGEPEDPAAAAARARRFAATEERRP